MIRIVSLINVQSRETAIIWRYSQSQCHVIKDFDLIYAKINTRFFISRTWIVAYGRRLILPGSVKLHSVLRFPVAKHFELVLVRNLIYIKRNTKHFTDDLQTILQTFYIISGQINTDLMDLTFGPVFRWLRFTVFFRVYLVCLASYWPLVGHKKATKFAPVASLRCESIGYVRFLYYFS